ncbi:putative DCC family thiol-disulfide oxidoreductase YuxK [Cellvibrio fibrivorans]|uniref:DCC family thiol-disulfide oxidoreductase YuxK n=1 Tax=Cellvibrio fibrivorans TaxID=126350 RepID=A0ABU1V121_9GAMM|nr:putative DCC family thiol-disulfide oxidoreductase YuxK [Cellvibrio fibrivorans]
MMVLEAKYPPAVNPGDQIILFDAVCKLCNRWSRFIIRFDKQHRFTLCSVQSEQGQAILQWFGYPLDRFETMLLVQGDQAIAKSDAFLEIVRQLPLPWPLLGIAKILPQKVRDWCYDRIALNRYELFGKYEYCLLANPDHERRFL